MATINLRAKFFVLAWIYFFFKPKASINGGPEQQLVWGDNVLQAPAGTVHVKVHTPYMFPRRVGVAETVVEVPANGSAALAYSPPLIVFLKGKLKRLS